MIEEFAVTYELLLKYYVV